MGTKIIELDDFTPSGEAAVQLVHPGFGYLDNGVKTASEALDYIKNVKPVPGKTVILVLAMTAGEFYGPNRNGDAWPERPLQVGPTKIGPESVLPKHYRTFETHAKVYRHHVNKDPTKSIGDVMKAFYNWIAHRVELLLALDNEKAKDFVQDIESGKTPAVSMGCRVPYDCCSLCGNKAPTRAQYCRHAREHLGEITDEGHSFVWNPDPLFFDISGVRRPADRLGWMLKKVAGETEKISSAFMGEAFDTQSNRAANLRKLSIIHKMVRGNVGAVQDSEANVVLTPEFIRDVAEKSADCSVPIKDEMIKRVLDYKPAELFSTLSRMGIILTTPEFIKYFVWQFAPNVEIPDELLRRAVALQGLAFEFLAENPVALQDIVDTGMFDEVEPNAEIAAQFQPVLEKRSQIGEYLYRNLVPSAFKPPSRKGLWDVLTVQDPYTGRTYQTTRSAATAAKDWSAEHQLTDLAGGGLLGAAAYKLMKMPRFRFLGIPAGLGSAALGYRGLTAYPTTRATSGELIALPRQRMPWEARHSLFGRGGTEMVEKRGSTVHDGIAAIVALQDMAQTGCVESIEKQLIKNAGLLSFDEAAAWLGRCMI